MRYVPFNGSLCASVPSEFTLHRDMRSQRQSRKGTHTWLIPILLTLPLSKQKHPCDSNTTKWRRQSWSSLSVAKTTRMQNSVATQRRNACVASGKAAREHTPDSSPFFSRCHCQNKSILAILTRLNDVVNLDQVYQLQRLLVCRTL